MNTSFSTRLCSHENTERSTSQDYILRMEIDAPSLLSLFRRVQVPDFEQVGVGSEEFRTQIYLATGNRLDNNPFFDPNYEADSVEGVLGRSGNDPIPQDPEEEENKEKDTDTDLEEERPLRGIDLQHGAHSQSSPPSVPVDGLVQPQGSRHGRSFLLSALEMALEVLDEEEPDFTTDVSF